MLNIFSSFVALAQEVQKPVLTCTVNGQSVPCDQIATAAAGAGIFGLVMAIAFCIIGLAAGIFWIVMLVHLVKNPVENKPLWVIIVLLFGIVGAIVYYFAVKRPMAIKAEAQKLASAVPEGGGLTK